MNVLITGVTGLIGSALASELQRRGDKVIGVSRSPSAGQISWKGVTPTFLNEVDAVVNPVSYTHLTLPTILLV